MPSYFIFTFFKKSHLKQPASMIYELIMSGNHKCQVRMTDVVDDINEKHMRPWSDACQRDNISNTPLNPFIDQVS